MINATQIKPHMPVVCSNEKQFATVDHVDGQSLKLAKDDQGQHHFIPLAWVKMVDDKVHIDRPGQEAMKQWKTAASLGLRHPRSRGPRRRRRRGCGPALVP